MAEYALNRDGGKSDEIGFAHWMKEAFGQGILNTRTTTSWKVTQRGAGANMSVDVAAGDGFIAINSYLHIAFSDATTNVAISTADPTNPRIDTVVAYIDRSVVSNVSNNNPGALAFVSVAGTPAGSPTAPSGGTIQTAVGASNPYLVLANVAVAAATSNIVNANITDTRVSIAYAGKLYGGSSNTVGHTIPNVADDTVALLNAAQTFTNKTLTNPTLNDPIITGSDGWQSLSTTVSSVTANGNRSYSLTVSNDKTNIINNGTRIRTTRTVAAPTQCADLELSSSQYYSKTSPNKMTFTDDFVCSAWIKVESVPTQINISSRYNGTSGWDFQIDPSGRVALYGFNAGAANFNGVVSYQSVPLGRWVHVVAQLDMSSATLGATNNYVMIDGVDVPAFKNTGGTAPTALIQAGNFEVGSWNGGLLPFDGKLAQVAVFNAKVTQSTIRGYMSQTLAGTETSLASAYSFNNSVTDLNTTTPNDLTANGGAAATNTDSPFGGQASGSISSTLDYGIVTNITASVITLQIPEGCTVPTTGGISAVAYSTSKAPYGMTTDAGRWAVDMRVFVERAQNSPSAAVYYNIGNALAVPIGSWMLGFEATFQATRGAASDIGLVATLSTANNTRGVEELIAATYANSITVVITTLSRRAPTLLSSSTVYYLNAGYVGTAPDNIKTRGEAYGFTRIFSEFAYL